MQGTVIAVTARGLQVKRDDGATVEAAARGWVRLGDRVQIDGDGGARKVAARPAFETKGAR